MNQALVEQARDGDEDAFARLVRDVIDRLFVIARLILHDPDDADDAVQETLVRAWRELPRLRESDRFEAWLRRLLINACHDVGRGRRRQALVRFAVSVPRPERVDAWRAVDERDRLRRAFDRLPFEQRTVLVLAHYVGLSGPEIATAVGVPLGTIKSRFRYATRAMQAALEADERIVQPARGGLP